MTRRLRFATAIVPILALGPVSSGQGVLVVGSGIGPVRIGMRASTVIQRIGQPMRKTSVATSGKRITIYSYPNLTVLLKRTAVLKQSESLRVIGLATSSRTERTVNGLGVGSTRDQLRQALRRLECVALSAKDVPAGVDVSFQQKCTVRSGETRTDFALVRGEVTSVFVGLS